ncbi:MAG: hypothetical protein HN561_05810 [Candidatus Scalindua sp.]|nr:hypothetical protein [Candidatus Scalindua sp.]
MKNKPKIFFIIFFVIIVLAKNVCALPDVTKYVPVDNASNVPPGTPLAIPPDSSGSLPGNITIGSVDSATGAVIIDIIEDCNGDGLGNLIHSNFPMTAHYWDGGNVKPFGWAMQNTFNNIPASQLQSSLDAVNTQGDFCIYRISVTSPCLFTMICYTDSVNANYNDQFIAESGQDPDFTIADVPDGLGTVASGTINDIDVDFYEFEEDVPQTPDCFDGIQNQDETGVDCGGVCELNFGLACYVPPPETCSDGIMNQDETGIDFGGVCGTGAPVVPPPDPATFIDNNTDGIDDVTGLTGTGSIPIATPGGASASTYDTSLPGDVSEIGETDWSTLITDFISLNPLVALAQGTTIDLVDSTCRLDFTLWGKQMAFDFCQHQDLVDLFGVFVLLIFTVRSIFVALGV